MTSILTVDVPAQPARYDLAVGFGSIAHIKGLPQVVRASKVLLLVDKGIPESLRTAVAAALDPTKITALLEIPSGEKSKEVSQLTEIWKFLSSSKADRRSVLLNLGGGMVGDLGGFAASTYMRGVPFVQIPTTLLSQVDASIGGKVAINFDGIKNLIGTITPPAAVIIDLNMLATLSDREFRSGFAEIVKHGLIRDRELAESLFSRNARDWNSTDLEAIIVRSCEIKRDVVQRDPFESGERKILNFGHTVAHALESLSHQSGTILLHGEAVSIGMIIEANIALRAGLLPQADYDSIVAGIGRTGLSNRVPHRYPIQSVMELISRDKKNQGSEVRWSLISAIGAAVYDQVLPAPLVEKSLMELCCG